MEDLFRDIRNHSMGLKRIRYTWRDSALYALSVGAGAADLPYIYENYAGGMKALPSFGSLTYFQSALTDPETPYNYNSIFWARDHLREQGYDIDTGLNLGHEMTVFRPIDPLGGVLLYDDRITDIYDWGERGVILVSEITVWDGAGNRICVNRNINTLPIGGNSGLPKKPKSTVVYPEREPDRTAETVVSPVAHALFRLTSDRDPHHIDPEIAAERGTGGVFLQGLYTFGAACRMLIDALIPGEPERMTGIRTEMRGIVFPGRTLRLDVWKTGDHEAVFRLSDTATGKAVLDRCTFEWK